MNLDEFNDQLLTHLKSNANFDHIGGNKKRDVKFYAK